MTKQPETAPAADDSSKSTQTPEQKPDAKAAPTPEELEEQAAQWMALNGFAPKKKPAEKPPEKAEEKAEEAEKPAERAEEPESKPDPKPEKKEKSPLQTQPAAEDESEIDPELAPTIDPEELATKTADILEARQKASQKPEPAIPDDLNDEDREVLEAVQHLQATDARFKGKDLVTATKEYWKKEQAYIDQWERDNAGEEFDASNKEFVAWQKRNMPAYSDADLQRAQKSLDRQRLKEEVRREVRSEYEPKIKQFEAEKAYEKALPEINTAASAAIGDMVVEAVPELKELIVDDSGRFNISQEIITDLEKNNPALHRLLEDEAADLTMRITELEKFSRLSQHGFKLNPDMEVEGARGTIFPHKEILSVSNSLERALAKKSPRETVRDGKVFITRKEMADKLDAVASSNLPQAQKEARIDALYRRHWFVDLPDIRDAIVAEAAGRVKKIASHLPKKFSKKGPVKAQEKPVEETEKPKSSAPPSLAASSDQVDTRKRLNTDSNDSGKILADKSFG